LVVVALAQQRQMLLARMVPTAFFHRLAVRAVVVAVIKVETVV
jgi:hypothetical protein